jgi:glycerol-3-phosphate dehydrogenase
VCQIDPDVRLWVHEEIVDGRKLSEIVNTEHENVKCHNACAVHQIYCVFRYLPGIKLPENVRAVTDLAEACDDASILVFVLPHQVARDICATQPYRCSFWLGRSRQSRGVAVFDETAGPFRSSKGSTPMEPEWS